jgi:hypothetical protein
LELAIAQLSKKSGETPTGNTLAVNQDTVMNCHLTHHPAVHFRQRISGNLINKLNERMVKRMRETSASPPEKKKDNA